jgi:hypothetical protein
MKKRDKLYTDEQVVKNGDKMARHIIKKRQERFVSMAR